jgi:acetyl-CoA synthetase
MTDHAAIESVLNEDRVFPPPPEFSASAHIKSFEEYERIYNEAAKDVPAFWAKQAEALDWFNNWDKVLEWNEPFAKWFVGGKINISYNCLDRHLSTWRKNKAAFIWEGEPGEVRTLTYQQLHAEVCRFANVLKKTRVKTGDRVALYMPLVPELAIAMLACARIGATHTVIFGGFSADAIRDRVNDGGCKVIVTADGGYRRGKEIKLKPIVDEAVEQCPGVEHVIVYKRTGSKVSMTVGRDHWWHELLQTVNSDCPAEPLDSEHPLYILYTSGTTGKPKGILHTTGGYLTQVAYTTKVVFDLKDEDVYWCTADIGWVTGHSYVVYGPLTNGATVMMYEGAPNHPDFDRFWDIIERQKITILYTAPTAIRSFIRWGEQYPLKHDLSSLRLLGTVGEPINPEAWMWYHRVIGKEKCPIVDTWWQTETGSIMISPLPGATPTVPGTATRPLPGIIVDVVNKQGEPVGTNEGGYLVIKHPWPSMLRTLWGDDQRYKQTYWSEYPGCYFAGDGARRDERGYYWIMGRVDDVINVSGHRLGTAEVESALVSHEAVAEAAVVGRPDDLKGQAIAAFVTLEGGRTGGDELKEELRAHVAKEIGALAKPDDIRFTDALPKTRSGKIMRRLLRELATSGHVAGDVTTLEDFSVLEKLREDEE